MNTTTRQKSDHEPGYKALLVRQETKDSLRELRARLPDRDLCQERRLATAALEVMLEMAEHCPETKRRWMDKVHDVVRRDLVSSSTAA